MKMKILWITNILFPEAEQLLTGSGELKATGGWLLGGANALLERGDVQLCVAAVSARVSRLTKLSGQRITYYVIPYGKGNLKYNADYEPCFRQIKAEVNPDVVHVHGTEYSHALAYLRACGSEHVVASIQGLISCYVSYYRADLSCREIYPYYTVRDLIRGGIPQEQKKFYWRGEVEKQILQGVHHVIGRTSWDKAHTWAINPQAKYHFCNETLRPEFYEGSRWNYDDCRRHTIFLSQVTYPIKGFHQVLKAMPIILRHYPDTVIRATGPDLLNASFLMRQKQGGYQCYIRSLIHKLHLEEQVCFTGYLNAEQMKQEYLRANVFVCPSSIENSPNSLGEAQILGVPCVASYVGGIADMMRGNENCLYRFEDVEMLAQRVCQVFASGREQFDATGMARGRHGATANANRLMDIYNSICQ